VRPAEDAPGKWPHRNRGVRDGRRTVRPNDIWSEWPHSEQTRELFQRAHVMHVSGLAFTFDELEEAVDDRG